jgi:hypothetical protein
MSAEQVRKAAPRAAGPVSGRRNDRPPVVGSGRGQSSGLHSTSWSSSAGLSAAGNPPSVGDARWRADNRSATAVQPRAQSHGPQSLQRLCMEDRGMEDRACRKRDRAVPSQRHARPAAFLRLGTVGCGRELKALSEYLGHSDPGLTLRTYTHLLPTSEQRTRQAVDRPLTGVEQRPTACPRPRSGTDPHFRWSAARDA